MRGHGRKKVRFGSHHPRIAPAERLAQVDALGLDDDARRRFLDENARGVFRRE